MAHRGRDLRLEPGLLQRPPPGIDARFAQLRARGPAHGVVNVLDQPTLAERQPQNRRLVRVGEQRGGDRAHSRRGTKRGRITVEKNDALYAPGVFQRGDADVRSAGRMANEDGGVRPSELLRLDERGDLPGEVASAKG